MGESKTMKLTRSDKISWTAIIFLLWIGSLWYVSDISWNRGHIEGMNWSRCVWHHTEDCDEQN